VFADDGERAEFLKKAKVVIERDPERRERVRRSMAVAEPIIDELHSWATRLKPLVDLTARQNWKTALPLLLRWLPLLDDDLDIKQEIIRCLSVPWIGDGATDELIEEFKKFAPIESS
jgi:hypothetical protein